MLATDRFLLISVGRTGTGGLHKWLQEVPGLQIISNLPHERHDGMAAKCIAAGLSVPPAWTVIRNPWDYYVDKYLWERNVGPCFKGTFKEFLQKTREQPTVAGYFYSLTQKWDDLGADMCEWVLRYENYEEEVVALLSRLIGDLLPSEEIRRRTTMTIVGVSYLPDGTEQFRAPSCHSWYDSETADWIADLDRKIIEDFGYEFLGTS